MATTKPRLSPELEGDPTLSLSPRRIRFADHPPVSVHPSAGPLPFSVVERPQLGMRCLACNGRVERSTVPVRLDREGCRLLLDAVPAWVCTVCLEEYFEPRQVELIRKALGTAREVALRR